MGLMVERAGIVMGSNMGAVAGASLPRGWAPWSSPHLPQLAGL